MKPLLHPLLVNGPFGDPVLYVEYLFERRALLFDIGDVRSLATRKILRVSDLFISHTHMDHFMDFDWLLRICLGRERRLNVYGPPGLIAQVEHKLAAYTWNLVENYDTDFTVTVAELSPDGTLSSAEFHCRQRFQREAVRSRETVDGLLLDEPALSVRGTFLDHKIPCLAFALEEKQHINVWKNRLQEMGLPTGPWLRELKRAVLRGDPDDRSFEVQWREEGASLKRVFDFGTLRDRLLHRVPGQKIAYVVDTAFSALNAERIVGLARGADWLFIEASFLSADSALGARKAHLTAAQAGRLARDAGVNRVVPLNISARYGECEEAIRAELEAAFSGGGPDVSSAWPV